MGKLGKVVGVVTLIFTLGGCLQQPSTSPTPSSKNPSPEKGRYLITGHLGDTPESHGKSGLVMEIDGNGYPLWVKRYGKGKNDYIYTATSTPDGGYILAGYTQRKENGKADGLLIKIDKNGELEWIKVVGGKEWDELHTAIPTSDGGYLAVGFTDSFGNGGEDIWVLKLNRSGQTQWEETYGGPGNEEGYGVLKTSDGGYLIAGNLYPTHQGGEYRALTLKIDKKGKREWLQTYGGAYFNEGYKIIKALDGGYLIGGYTKSNDNANFDGMLIKLDKNGYQQWIQTYGGSGDEAVTDITPTPDKKGYLLVGWTNSFGMGKNDILAVKVNLEGERIWIRNYGGSDWDVAQGVVKTPSGYLIVGDTSSFGRGKMDIILIKIDWEGIEKWIKTYGGKEWDEASSIIEVKK